jgi:hypothetical protein
MLKDIFPQNAVDLCIIKKNGLIFRYFAKKEKELYKLADYIGCMSLANKDYLLSHNPWLNPEKVEIFPNTKKLADNIKANGFPLREKYGIPKEACVFLFGGNMGRPQCIDLLCEAVKECKEKAEIYFLFIGRGTDRYKLEQTIEENAVNNSIVIENLPRCEYEQVIKECDVGLIVLDPRFTIPNYPSRILSYMEYAKPVLAATDNVTDIKELIEQAQCGEWIWSGDRDGFVSIIRKMANEIDFTNKGINGRRYIEDNFQVERSINLLKRHFK